MWLNPAAAASPIRRLVLLRRFPLQQPVQPQQPGAEGAGAGGSGEVEGGEVSAATPTS